MVQVNGNQKAQEGGMSLKVRVKRISGAEEIVEMKAFPQGEISRRDYDRAVKLTREAEMKKVESRALDTAEDRVLDVLLPPARNVGFGGSAAGGAAELTAPPDSATRQKFRKRLREGDLDDKEIELEVQVPMPEMGLAGPAGMEELTQQLQGRFRLQIVPQVEYHDVGLHGCYGCHIGELCQSRP
jgi:ATP-dependent protease HslVU (ClpYQ) ATPase subunit